jgi:predicted ATPase
MSRLTISLLGSLQVKLDGKPITDFATDKTRALLAYLAVEARRPHRRDALAELLWSDQSQRKARQNLRKTLSYLRDAIGDRTTDGDRQDAEGPFLLISRETVQFNPDSDYWLDVAAFKNLATACQSHRHRQLEICRACMWRLEQMMSLYQGSFLEQFSLSDSNLFEEWALLEREFLHNEAVEALCHLADYAERRGDYQQARQYVHQQVVLEPWHEDAHCQLMRLLALDGQRSAALAQYEACRRALAQELGIEPMAETVALYEQISQSPNQQTLADLQTCKLVDLHNLPPAPTPFVGRKKELFELADMLANPDCRLVTLFGPGGIGKTRLALQTAADQIGAFAHGVYHVPLAAVSSTDSIALTIANRIGCAMHGSQDPKEQLVEYLREKDMLLVLDNMEHLIAPSAPSTNGGDSDVTELLSEILRRAPGVVILVTSRERTGLQEEWVYVVEGLTYPESEDVDEAILKRVAGTKTYSAIDLFQRRALQANQRFQLSKTEIPHMVRICQLVEGMPLGVELAAAWVKVCPCKEIAQEIERNLDILTTPLRNVPTRQRSIRATFEHSWNLLSEQEQVVFCKLSVFCGGFEAEAADQVADASRETLESLVSKSLLRQDVSGRYHIHELLRQYAQEKLDQMPQQREMIQDQHCQYYALFLQHREAWLKGGRQKKALTEINVEIENVRAGWRWAITQGKIKEIGRALDGLGCFDTLRSWYREGAGTFGQTAGCLEPHIAQNQDSDQQVVLGQVLAWQGYFSFQLGLYEEAQEQLGKSLDVLRQCGVRQETAFPMRTLAYVLYYQAGDHVEADRLFRESLALCQAAGDQYGMAQSLDGMADVAGRLGDYAENKRCHEQCLVICQEIGDLWGIASSLGGLGVIAGMEGNYETAKARFQEGIAVFREIDNRRGIAGGLHNLSTVAYICEDYVEAKRLRQETLAICREIGYRWGITSALRSLGDVACRLGEYEEAKQFLQESLTIAKEIDNYSSQAFTLCSLGNVAKALGDTQEAGEYFRQALSIAMDIQMPPLALDILTGMVELAAQKGETEQALELGTFVLHHPATEQQLKDRLTPLQDEILSQLDPNRATAAQAREEERQLDDIVADILHGKLLTQG